MELEDDSVGRVIVEPAAPRHGTQPSDSTARSARHKRRAQRRRDYDVVFYTPWIGAILSTGGWVHPGGAETQVLMLAQALVLRGLRVAIVAFGEPTQLPSQVEGVTIVPRPVHKRCPRLIDKCVEVLRVWQSLWRVPSPTIVYRTAGFELGVIALYARLARRRLVFASAQTADFQHERVQGRHLRLLVYKLGVRLANTIVVQTDEQIDLCETTFGRTPALIKSIAPLAEPQVDVPTAFLWVGRLVTYKRPLEYIALAQAFPEAEFWMIGIPSPWTHQDDQVLAESVARQARDVPNLQLLPTRPHAQIGPLMGRAVASVNTADFEGMPNVLLEAWSRGVPALVLTHDPDGVVEKYGLGGVAGGSFEKFVELARQMWADRHDRDGLLERCRTYIASQHAPEIVAEQWARIIMAPRQRANRAIEPKVTSAA